YSMGHLAHPLQPLANLTVSDVSFEGGNPAYKAVPAVPGTTMPMYGLYDLNRDMGRTTKTKRREEGRS
ncbi:hypothetical protein NDU88_000731, partial [Pleurodeles waltl]